LRARRLKTYSGLAARLEALFLLANLFHMWSVLFPDEARPETSDLLEVSAALFHLVDAHLFPIEWDWLDSLYDTSGGDVVYVLRLDIPFVGYGLELNETAFLDHAACDLPLLAALCPAEGGVWWEDMGYPWPERGFTWLDNPDPVGILAGLPAPFDGLATLYHCIWQESGNPFLDEVDPFWRGMVTWPELYWCVEDVQRLAQAYQEAKPWIARYDAYADWFHEVEGPQAVDPGPATRQVIELLLQLEADYGDGD